MGKIKKQQQLASINDVCLLNNSSIAQDMVVQHLKSRYESNNVYTRINDEILIAMLNNKSFNFNEQESMEYVAEYKNTLNSGTILPPHIYQTVNQVYLHMRRTGIDQSILLRYFSF